MLWIRATATYRTLEPVTTSDPTPAGQLPYQSGTGTMTRPTDGLRLRRGDHAYDDCCPGGVVEDDLARLAQRSRVVPVVCQWDLATDAGPLFEEALRVLALKAAVFELRRGSRTGSLLF